MRTMIFAGCLLLGACDRSPPVPTAAENRQLDEAANLLDSAPDRLDNIDANALGPANSAG